MPHLAVCLLLATAPAAQAATLRVGPNQPLKAPSEAAAIAQDGDMIVIEPGEYFDCAVWRANDLIVTGSGPGVVLTDRACEGKALFITRGKRITLRDLTFTRVRVPDRNGAGVRFEAGSLLIERSRFINNEVGILAADVPGASLVLRDCEFARNGAPGGRNSAADLLIGQIALLRAERSRFAEPKEGAAITSAALRTELVGDRFSSDGATAPLSIVSLPEGGSLLMDDDAFNLVAGRVPRLGAVAVAGDMQNIEVRRTVLANPTGEPAVLLRDWGAATPVLEGNQVLASDVEVSTNGALLHRLKVLAHRLIDGLRRVARSARHVAAGWHIL